MKVGVEVEVEVEVEMEVEVGVVGIVLNAHWGLEQLRMYNNLVAFAESNKLARSWVCNLCSNLASRFRCT